MSQTIGQSTTEISPAKNITAGKSATTSASWDLDRSSINKTDFFDKEIILNDLVFDSQTDNGNKKNNSLLDEEDIQNEDPNVLNSSFLKAEGFLPVHNKAFQMEDRPQKTTDFDDVTYNPNNNYTTDSNVDYDSKVDGIATTITELNDMKTITGSVPDPKILTNSINVNAKVPKQSKIVVKRRQTSEMETLPLTSISTPIEIGSNEYPVISTEAPTSEVNVNVRVSVISEVPETSTVSELFTIPEMSTVFGNSAVVHVSHVPVKSSGAIITTVPENFIFSNLSAIEETSTISKIFKMPISFTITKRSSTSGISTASKNSAFLGISTNPGNSIVTNISTTTEASTVKATSTLSDTSTTHDDSIFRKVANVSELSTVLNTFSIPENFAIPSISRSSDTSTQLKNFAVAENSRALNITGVPENVSLTDVSKLENSTKNSSSSLTLTTDIFNTKPTLSQHTQSTTLTPTQAITNPLISLNLKVREEETLDSQDPKTGKLFVKLETLPVITNTIKRTFINNVNKTVAETGCAQNNSINIPRLEIIAESPVDVHFRLCPSNCNKQHEHNCKYIFIYLFDPILFLFKKFKSAQFPQTVIVQYS